MCVPRRFSWPSENIRKDLAIDFTEVLYPGAGTASCPLEPKTFSADGAVSQTDAAALLCKL